jgi:hypothetical protein
MRCGIELQNVQECDATNVQQDHQSRLHKKSYSKSSFNKILNPKSQIINELCVFFFDRLIVFINQLALQFKRHCCIFMKTTFEFCTALRDRAK